MEVVGAGDRHGARLARREGHGGILKPHSPVEYCDLLTSLVQVAYGNVKRVPWALATALQSRPAKACREHVGGSEAVETDPDGKKPDTAIDNFM